MAPVGEIDLDTELLEIILAGQARIKNDRSKERSKNQCDKTSTMKKSLSRPGPLSKKRKLEALESSSGKADLQLKKTELISNIPLVSSSSGNSIAEERIKSKVPVTNGQFPAPEISTTNAGAGTNAKHAKPTARPGPLSKKPKLQVTKPILVPAAFPSLNVKSKDNRSIEKPVNFDNDDIRTEIVEFERAVPLKSTIASKPRQKNDKEIKESKPSTRPGPLSKKVALVKTVIKNTQENCTDNKNKKVSLRTSNDCVPKINNKVKSKVQRKEKIQLDNSTSAKSEESKQPSQSTSESPSTQINHHGETLILQQTKRKDGIRKPQDELIVPVSLEMIMNTFGSKTLMDIQKSLNANKCLNLFELVLPHIWMDLNLKDLLQCRQACKRWNQKVDTLLENHPYRGGKNEEIENDFSTNRPKSTFHRHPFANRYDKQCSQFEFISLDKIISFLAKTRNHPRSPFVTKSVLVRLSMELNDEELSAYLDGVTELFQMYGKHVWYLHLDIQGYHSIEKTFKIIQQVLENLHNLKSLQLMCHARDTPTTVTTDEEKKLIAQESLPSLPYLESLDLCDVKLSVDLIGVFIKKYCSSLLKLHVSLYRWKESYSHQIVNLRELSITAMCSQDNLNHLYCQLKNLKHLQRLSKISLVVMVTLDTKKMFGILKHFEGLQTVKIIILEHMGNKLHFEHESRETDDDRPKLPQVHSLELSLTSAQKSLNFLKFFLI